MTAYAKHATYHKKRRGRFSQSSPPKALARIHRKPELITTGQPLTGAQLRAVYAITQDLL